MIIVMGQIIVWGFFSRRPRISALGEVLNEVHEINRRFQPFLERYQQLLLDDPELSAQVSNKLYSKHVLFYHVNSIQLL